MMNMENRAKVKKKTQVRAFRFEDETINQLENLAASEGSSLNAFVNHVLKQYVEYTHPALQYDSKLLHGAILKNMIDLIETERLTTMARQTGQNMFKEIIASGWALNNLLFFKRILRELFCQCANWANYNESRHGNKLMINLSHYMGLKYSEFMKNYFYWEISQLEDVKIADVVFLCSESSLIMSFPWIKDLEMSRPAYKQSR